MAKAGETKKKPEGKHMKKQGKKTEAKGTTNAETKNKGKIRKNM